MREEPPGGLPATSWHLAYLGVTLFGIAFIFGARHSLGTLHDHLELATLGIVVGMFTVTSLLHWYDVKVTGPTVQISARRR